MKDLLNEICLWLSHQKGAIPQDYAKDLAKYIAKENHEQKEFQAMREQIKHLESQVYGGITK
jgi:polyhydroxyalkanoate synthesis regulator phasin